MTIRIMLKKTILTTLILSTCLWGQEFSKAGTSAAQFLKFPVDARTAALASSHAGLYGDVASLHWNPAGIAALKQTSMALTYSDMYLGIRHSFLGIVMPLPKNGAIGISAIVLDSGEIEQTTVSQPQGTGALFHVRNYAFGLSFARYMTGWLMLGGTIKYVREDIWNESAQAVAFDIGSVLETGVLGMKLGMSISNFGTDMKLEGDDLKFPLETNAFTIQRGAEFKTEHWPLPWRFQAGVAVDVIGGTSQIMQNKSNRLTALGQYNEFNDVGAQSNFGMEYQWNNILSARVGYFNEYDAPKISYGLGVAFNVEERRLNLDFALVDNDKLGFVQLFSLEMTF